MAECGLRYAGKVTIVTGGARGIGKGVVEAFVRNGSKVVFCDVRAEEGEKLEADLNKGGKESAKFVICDVKVEEELKKLVNTTVECFGKIDCVAAIAGFHPPPTSIDDFVAEKFHDLVKLNVTHPLLLAKFALPHLRKTQGNIIFMASINATISDGGAVEYDATKGAVAAMTRTLAIAESKYSVRVNSVSPGTILTPLAEEFMASCNLENPAEYFGSYNLLNRLGDISEVGNACVYLAAEATFCTGFDLKMSAGTELGFAPKVRGSP